MLDIEASKGGSTIVTLRESLPLGMDMKHGIENFAFISPFEDANGKVAIANRYTSCIAFTTVTQFRTGASIRILTCALPRSSRGTPTGSVTARPLPVYNRCKSL